MFYNIFHKIMTILKNVLHLTEFIPSYIINQTTYTNFVEAVLYSLKVFFNSTFQRFSVKITGIYR